MSSAVTSQEHREGPVLPAFGRGCVTELVPTLLGVAADPTSMPFTIDTKRQQVLLVLDGLGWEQLQDRQDLSPTLTALDGGPITTVAPSTTATALTSITTGLTPAEHGIVGYRMLIDGEVLNALRWGTNDRHDCRRTIPPSQIQPFEPFVGERVDYVSKAEFAKTGFTEAHLRGANLRGYRTTAVMVHQIRAALDDGAPFVYAYYDGVDKVSHEFGFGDAFDAEFAFADRLVADVLAAVPSGTQVVVTADHGQVHCPGPMVGISSDVLALCDGLSGEARFRWLHARRGAEAALLSAARAAHDDVAWVVGIEQMIDEKWFGSHLAPGVLDRYGDVALVPFEPTGFDDPDDGGLFPLIGRHGSLTAAEMLVPALSATT